MSEEVLTLGGQRFDRVVKLTIERDLFIRRRVRAAGLEDVEIRAGETEEAFAMRLLGLLVTSESALELLGAFMVPEGKEWTPEIAKETAKFIGQLSDDRDHRAIHALILEVLAAFFARGTVSLWSSTGSSSGGRGRPDLEGSTTPSGNGAA